MEQNPNLQEVQQVEQIDVDTFNNKVLEGSAPGVQNPSTTLEASEVQNPSTILETPPESSVTVLKSGNLTQINQPSLSNTDVFLQDNKKKKQKNG